MHTKKPATCCIKRDIDHWWLHWFNFAVKPLAQAPIAVAYHTNQNCSLTCVHHDGQIRGANSRLAKVDQSYQESDIRKVRGKLA